ncbi:MAG: LytR/AlgR family response regulator transcription factor [Candidatus Gastranaerophilaceae bacterium]
MNIAICDDDREYIKNIENYVNLYFENKSIDFKCSKFENGENLLSSNQDFDILFLDIELGDSNGIEIAKEMQARDKHTVILIVTSYHQYLDDAMDINVTRYIDKPVSQNRIFSALDKALSVINESVITFTTKDHHIARLRCSDIVYVEAKFKGVYIYTKNGDYRIKEPIKQLRSMLSGSCFAVPHNSYIVNLNYITDFKRDEITLADPYANIKISIATRKQAEFKRRFLDFVGEDILND